MTPENAGFFHAAYAVAITVYALYGASLWWRRRALARRTSGARQ